MPQGFVSLPAVTATCCFLFGNEGEGDLDKMLTNPYLSFFVHAVGIRNSQLLAVGVGVS